MRLHFRFFPSNHKVKFSIQSFNDFFLLGEEEEDEDEDDEDDEDEGDEDDDDGKFPAFYFEF